MSIKEKEYLELFKKQSEQMLGWGDSEDWSNADFEKLSELVFEKTGVTLSISTLKRVWGKVKYNSAPTTTTLNTLVQFSGYDSWRSFCAEAQPDAINKIKKQPPPEKEIKKIIPNKSKWIVAVIAGALMVFSAVWISFFNKPALIINASKITFTSRVVSDELPNSVVFNYDIGNIKADSVIIQQSWDKNRREKVPAHQHQHTSIYYYPGFFNARLIINNKVVKQHEVFIKTKGWKGFIDQQSQTRPYYLSDKDILGENGTMKIDAQTLTAKTGKSVFNDIYTVFCNAKEFNINGNNFTFITTLQNTSSKEQAICQRMQVNIVTSHGFIGLPLCAKGCISDLLVNVADISINGKDHDLSAFGCDFSKPQGLRLNVKDKKATIYLNQQPILTVPYTKPLGRLVSLRVIFEGTGEIKNIAVNNN